MSKAQKLRVMKGMESIQEDHRHATTPLPTTSCSRKGRTSPFLTGHPYLPPENLLPRRRTGVVFTSSSNINERSHFPTLSVPFDPQGLFAAVAKVPA
jgi:hypothetical protein